MSHAPSSTHWKHRGELWLAGWLKRWYRLRPRDLEPAPAPVFTLHATGTAAAAPAARTAIPRILWSYWQGGTPPLLVQRCFDHWRRLHPHFEIRILDDRGVLQYLPVGLLVGLIFLAELLMVAGTWVFAPGALKSGSAPMPDLAATPNTLALGELIYTRYAFFFEAAALILLVAMIGAIVLTLRHRAYVKRQDISVQVARTRDTAIEIVKVEPGKGL